jgi:hypothetical protein
MLAVLRTLGEEFVGLGWLFARKEKRRRGRRCGVLLGDDARKRAVAFS